MKTSLETAQKVADAVVKHLSPHCLRIEVAGSIRRRKAWVNDIDLVLIPKDPWELHNAIGQLGPTKMSGAKICRTEVQGIQVDIYFATPGTWATLLLIRTGSEEHNRRLATLAKNKGWHLHASGEGLTNGNGERIAGDTERSIFEALNMKYKDPWERD